MNEPVADWQEAIDVVAAQQAEELKVTRLEVATRLLSGLMANYFSAQSMGFDEASLRVRVREAVLAADMLIDEIYS